jgi:hypothetical protein
MQEFITPLQENLKNIYTKLHKQLSLEWIGFDIDYKDTHYSFYPPTTLQEHKILEKQKKKFIKQILKKKLKDAVDAIADEFEPDWGLLISFDDEYLSKWEEINPGEPSEVYEVSGETTDTKEKKLDTDSIILMAQRKDMTPEKWQEFFTNKFNDSLAGDAAKDMFEFNSRRDKLPDENSNS